MGLLLGSQNVVSASPMYNCILYLYLLPINSTNSTAISSRTVSLALVSVFIVDRTYFIYNIFVLFLKATFWMSYIQFPIYCVQFLLINSTHDSAPARQNYIWFMRGTCRSNFVTHESLARQKTVPPTVLSHSHTSQKLFITPYRDVILRRMRMGRLKCHLAILYTMCGPFLHLL